VSGDIDWEEMTVGDKIAAIKATISPRDLVDLLDDLDVIGDKIRSPHNPGERTPSCHLYDDHWFDYSTGKGGDVIDLAILLTGSTWNAAVGLLARAAQSEDLDIGRIARPAVAEELPDMTDDYQTVARRYLSLGLEQQVLADRIPGVLPNTWRALVKNRSVTVEGETILIPHIHDGVVRGVKVRGVNGQKSAWPGSKFTCGLYRFNTGVEYWSPTTMCVITEGETDCWALTGLVDADVFSLPSGAGLWRKEWLDELDRYDRIFTAFDNDHAGQQATEKVRASIGWGRWRQLQVPPFYNDVREAIIVGWKPRLPPA
jgi:hypothetical protein